MINTNNHNFHKPEQDDDILDTISKLGENFEKLDGLIEESTIFLHTHLVEGETYDSGKMIWNSVPTVGGYVGWVNIRTGQYAPIWESNKAYALGDLVIEDGNNGHVYACVVEGTSGTTEPVFPTVTSATVLDNTGHSTWQATTNYNVGDIVIATNGNTLYYYVCEIGGITNATEPTWTNIDGVTVNDSSILWRTHKTVTWREVGASCEFREFGMIN